MAQREPSEPVHAREGHVPDWVMQIPVGVLIVGSIGAGYLAIGGAQSPWWRFLSSLYGGAQATAPAPISELLSSLIVLAIVIAGVAVAYYRYGTRSATASAVERLRGEALRMPAVLPMRSISTRRSSCCSFGRRDGLARCSQDSSTQP